MDIVMPLDVKNRIKGENNKLVLTGVTGQKSGGVLIEYIAKHIDTINTFFSGGITVVCRETSNTSKVERLLPSALIKRGDFKNTEFMSEALLRADTVIHIAGIHWSREIVDAADENSVRRLILIHTTGIYSKYKAAGEEYRQIDEYIRGQCKEHNIILTILRPTMIYGNVRDNNVVTFIKMVDKLPIMPVVNGARYELQPVHYKDLGQAYFNVLMKEDMTANHEYDLSGGEVIQLRDMLTVIGRSLGKKVKFISCPFPIAYIGAWIMFILTIGKKDYREKVQRLCEPRVYSHEEASVDFGYNPRSFRKGIIDEVNEYKELKKHK